MLVVGAPLAALAENEWGTDAYARFSSKAKERCDRMPAWTVATGERESIITSAVGERNMQPWVSRAQKRAS